MANFDNLQMQADGLDASLCADGEEYGVVSFNPKKWKMTKAEAKAFDEKKAAEKAEKKRIKDLEKKYNDPTNPNVANTNNYSDPTAGKGGLTTDSIKGGDFQLKTPNQKLVFARTPKANALSNKPQGTNKATQEPSNVSDNTKVGSVSNPNIAAPKVDSEGYNENLLPEETDYTTWVVVGIGLAVVVGLGFVIWKEKDFLFGKFLKKK